jgi:hypothetical protein
MLFAGYAKPINASDGFRKNAQPILQNKPRVNDVAAAHLKLYGRGLRRQGETI